VVKPGESAVFTLAFAVHDLDEFALMVDNSARPELGILYLYPEVMPPVDVDLNDLFAV
jgi:hypothetical protein